MLSNFSKNKEERILPHSLYDASITLLPKPVKVTTNKENKELPGGSDGKASVYNVGDPGSIPGSGRSSGEGNGNPLQYSYLENPMDGGAW